MLSPDGRYDQLFLSNYADIYIREPLKRVPGVGEVRIFGSRDYSMRIWLDPVKLAGLGLAASYLGSLYVNSFNKFGHVYRVYLQAEKSQRANPKISIVCMFARKAGRWCR